MSLGFIIQHFQKRKSSIKVYSEDFTVSLIKGAYFKLDVLEQVGVTSSQ